MLERLKLEGILLVDVHVGGVGFFRLDSEGGVGGGRRDGGRGCSKEGRGSSVREREESVVVVHRMGYADNLRSWLSFWKGRGRGYEGERPACEKMRREGRSWDREVSWVVVGGIEGSSKDRTKRHEEAQPRRKRGSSKGRLRERERDREVRNDLLSLCSETKGWEEEEVNKARKKRTRNLACAGIDIGTEGPGGRGKEKQG